MRNHFVGLTALSGPLVGLIAMAGYPAVFLFWLGLYAMACVVCPPRGDSEMATFVTG